MLGADSLTKTEDFVSEVAEWQSKDLPVQTVVLTNSATDKMQNLQFPFKVADLQTALDAKNVTFMLPLSFVDVSTGTDPSALETSGATVGYNGKNLMVKTPHGSGLVADPFNKEFQTYMKAEMERLGLKSDGYAGFYLSDDALYVTSTDSFVESKQYDNMPYVPGEQSGYSTLSYNTLPMDAMHTFTAENAESLAGANVAHFNLHSLYGNQLVEALANVTGKFSVSQSTFAGAGRNSVGHPLAPAALTWDLLKATKNNLINYSIFGIPSTGAYICGSTHPAKETADAEELCLRSHQLAIVQPLAMTVQADAKAFPPSLTDDTLTGIKAAMDQRMSYLLYMHSEMAKIARNGGALLRPLSFDFPEDPKAETMAGNQLMFGEALKIGFVLEAQATKEDSKADKPQYDVYFPEGAWGAYGTDVTNVLTVSKGGVTYHFDRDEPVKIYQRAGTIVPW